MKAYLRSKPTQVPCWRAYKIDRLENKELPIPREDWNRGCDGIDAIFYGSFRKAYLFQFVALLPGAITTVAGMLSRNIIVFYIGLALFALWVISQCIFVPRFLAWLDEELCVTCDEMTASEGNVVNAEFSFGKVKGTCGFDAEYFVKITNSNDDNATMALSVDDTADDLADDLEDTADNLGDDFV